MQLSKEVEEILKDPSLLLIFAYAPAGLGHLRVTDALYHGLPEGVVPIILGSQDKSITFLHRLTSVSRLGRNLGEWFQVGIGEDIFTILYRRHLVSHTDLIYDKVLTLIDQHYIKPKKVLVVATHFSLAHQLGAVKKKIEKERKVKIYLAVQVTDDSPQHIWYIPTADVIFVPSEITKEELLSYAQKSNLEKTRVEVVPYPVSPSLTRLLSDMDQKNRSDQLSANCQSPIHVAVPISGAAVGLHYIQNLIKELHDLSGRFYFHIITRKADFTKNFIQKTKNKDYIFVASFDSDQKLVDAYEKLYEKYIIAFEITKPSEQSFKALIPFSMVGGSLLLFTKPIGRQEYDNLEFLFRKKLVPRLFYKGKINFGKGYLLKQDATGYRGICLPSYPAAAANLIDIALKENIFRNMMDHQLSAKPKSCEVDDEVKPDGVSQFWDKAVKYCLK